LQILLRRGLLNFKLPVIGYNQELIHLFEQTANDCLQKPYYQKIMTHKVKKNILLHFKHQIPQLEEVASLFNLTTRSLQRKLKVENTNFQEITEEIREQLAIGLLQCKQFTVNEIAYMLGYAEASTFRRAFKRWTGKSPTSY
jgi:AraC-like DNA-binding protein